MSVYQPGIYYCGHCGARMVQTGQRHLVCRRCQLREVVEMLLLIAIPCIGLAVVVAYTLVTAGD